MGDVDKGQAPNTDLEWMINTAHNPMLAQIISPSRRTLKKEVTLLLLIQRYQYGGIIPINTDHNITLIILTQRQILQVRAFRRALRSDGPRSHGLFGLS